VPFIRPAVDADGYGIAALIEVVFAEYDNCPFVAAEFPELQAPASHYRGRGGGLWVVDDDGVVAGSVALSRVDAERAELHKLYLGRSLRGSGLAAELYAIVEAEALARGARAIRLWTDTRFAAGHRFYEKLGFTREPVVRYLADATEAWEYAYRRELRR
jgi:putative acetyltransferase